MIPVCDIALKVPSTTTARIQEMHITLGQMLCGAIEQRLGLVDVSYADEGPMLGMEDMASMLRQVA